MKKLVALFFAIFFIASCTKFDDSDIWDKLNDHEYRIAYLEEVCKKMNNDIAKVQNIVTALETGDYIVNASPLIDGSGYSLLFKSGKSVIIYNGKDGSNGKDGTTPIISVMKDVDGIYYWTINGEWLLVNGNKVRASAIDGQDGQNGESGQDGQDGITPQFKIENDYWYISYDNGKSWEILGKATGSDGLNGNDGDSLFKRVYIEDGFVCFELNDQANTIIRIPLMKDGTLTVNVEQAGQLSTILSSEETRTTTSLTIKGNINLDDMRHLQIMNNLQKLDLKEALFQQTGDSPLILNPYQDTLINKSIEELILPQNCNFHDGDPGRIDFSYCLALKKIKILSNHMIFEYYDKTTSIREILFCHNVKTLEYEEGVTSGYTFSRWSSVNSLEEIIYPSTLKYIPSSITLYAKYESITVNGYRWAGKTIIPCKKIVCKATTPPVLDPSEWGSNYDNAYYDEINKGYYIKHSDKANDRSLSLVEVPQGVVLYVPKESIELYKVAPLWELFTDIRAIEE